MTLSLEISDEARRDLASIWHYSFEQWSEKHADNYFQGLKLVMRQLLENPASGVPVAIRPTVRKLIWESHVIYYRLMGERLQILRVLHHSMDVARHLPT